MDELTREALYKRQTDDIYRAIGKFSVKFEQVVFSMRLGITMIISKNGLRNQKLSNVIMADLTAYPVKSIFGSIIAETTALSGDDKRILNNVLKRVQELIDKINDITHSTWFVGWAGSETVTFDEVFGHKLARGKSGSHEKHFRYKSDDFEKLSAECDLINAIILRLSGVVVAEYSIAKNFVISETGEVSVPTTPENNC